MPAKAARSASHAPSRKVLPDPTAVASGELAKSGRTRQRIMEAAVDELAECGYVRTTTQSVATRAGLTRAAMLYHFPSRIDLIGATVHYVTRRRIEIYNELMSGLPHDPGFFEAAIDNAWAQTQTNYFRAFAELSTAARTDAELRAIFDPALAEFDRARRASALTLFPAASVEVPGFDLRRDISRFLLEGLAQQGGLSFDAERRHAGILNFLKALANAPEGRALLALAVKGPARPAKRRTGREVRRPWGSAET